jgi:PAS domain S-box-containing protein
MKLIRDKGVLMVDLEGRIVFANNYLCDLLGMRGEYLVGLSCFDLVFPEDMERAKALFEANTMPDAEPFRFRLKHRDGSAVWVDIQGSALRPAYGAVYGIVATVTRS